MENGKTEKKDIVERLLKFSVKIIKLASKLPKNSAGFVISKQIIKSGTSMGANAVEAQDASSRSDFIYKMNIALRESRETKYWLLVIEGSSLLSNEDIEIPLKEVNELCAILTTIIKNAKKNK